MICVNVVWIGQFDLFVTNYTRGYSLFHVVVDTDETASRVLDIMSQEKKGRCTFIPLNRLRPKNIEYPQANDALPM